MRVRKRPICLVCLCLIIVIWICKAVGLPIFGEPRLDPAVRELLQEEYLLRAEGTVTDRQQKSNSVLYILSNVNATVDGETIHFEKLKITVTDSEYAHIPLGAYAVFDGETSEIPHASNPGQFDSADYYAAERIFYEMFAADISVISEELTLRERMARLREKLSKNQAKVMHADQAGVLSSMILGQRSDLSRESRLNFQYGGIMHILAISALHISLLGMAVYRLVLAILVRILHRGRPAVVLAAAAAVLQTGIYCCFVGEPISAVRAFVMFLILMTARICLRTYDSLCALGLAGILLLLTNPGCLFASGFQLSFAAVLGASLLYPSLNAVMKRHADGVRHEEKREKRKRKVRESVLLWISIMLTTLPLTAWYYCEIPVLGGILNLLAVPFMGGVMALGAVGSFCTLISLRLGWLILIPVDLFLQALEAAGTAIRGVPFSMWIVGRPQKWQIVLYYSILILVICSIRVCMRRRRDANGISASHAQATEKRRVRICRRSSAALLTAAVCLLLWRPAVPCSLTMMDVGQGDGLVLRTGTDAAYLIDCGSTSENLVGTYRLIPYLKYCGIRHIKGIFVSHDDIDHYGGILELLEAKENHQLSIRIDRLLLPFWMPETEKGQTLIDAAAAAGVEVSFLSTGDRLTDGKLQLNVLYPSGSEGNGAQTDTGNDGSLVLWMKYEQFDALLTGDISSAVEARLAGKLPDIDCLKAAHHGSASSTSADFLQSTSPQIALISAPANSVYGHPGSETLERLTDADCDVYITRDCGAVTVQTDGEHVEVVTVRQSK